MNDRFVANADTAKTVAHASQLFAHRLKGRWIFSSPILVLFALLIMGVWRSGSQRAQVFWAITFALVPTASWLFGPQRSAFLQRFGGRGCASSMEPSWVRLRRGTDSAPQPDCGLLVGLA